MARSGSLRLSDVKVLHGSMRTWLELEYRDWIVDRVIGAKCKMFRQELALE